MAVPIIFTETQQHHHQKRFSGFLYRLRRNKKINFLPTLLTLGNGFFGFTSILFASCGDLVFAAYFILLGALFDALDGRIARLIGTSSSLGAQLDSLCDAITFCLAPAFLAYSWELNKMGIIGYLGSALFLLAGLFRLAKFNLSQEEQSSFFFGIPTTFAASYVAIILLTSQQYLEKKISVGVLLLMITLAYFMISSIPFPTLKKITKQNYIILLSYFLLCSILLGPANVLFFSLTLYFLFYFAKFFKVKVSHWKKHKNHIFH